MVNGKSGDGPVAVDEGVERKSMSFTEGGEVGNSEVDGNRMSHASVKSLSSKRASAMSTLSKSYQLVSADSGDSSAEPRLSPINLDGHQLKALEGIMRENEELESELKDKNEHFILLQSQNVQLWELITKLHSTIVDLQKDLERVVSDNSVKYGAPPKQHLPSLAKLKNLDISSVVNGIMGATPKSPSDRPTSHISQLSSTDRSSMNEWSKRSSQLQPASPYSPSFGNDALKFEESISAVVEETNRLSVQSAANRLSLDKSLPVSLIGLRRLFYMLTLNLSRILLRPQIVRAKTDLNLATS